MSKTGHINWYDMSSGHGSIISDEGVWYRINEFTEINGELSPKVQVKFELAIDSIRPIVKRVQVIFK